MYTIVNAQGKVLYCRLDIPIVDGEIAIDKMYSGEVPDGKQLFFNFETNEFYLKNEN